jgi:hypothetical protein
LEPTLLWAGSQLVTFSISDSSVVPVSAKGETEARVREAPAWCWVMTSVPFHPNIDMKEEFQRRLGWGWACGLPWGFSYNHLGPIVIKHFLQKCKGHARPTCDSALSLNMKSLFRLKSK